jgi:hypothetical protein
MSTTRGEFLRKAAGRGTKTHDTLPLAGLLQKRQKSIAIPEKPDHLLDNSHGTRYTVIY